MNGSRLNSTMVRLKLKIDQISPACKLSQFHYGSIKTRSLLCLDTVGLISLNSTMVRLKLMTKESVKRAALKSQFHYGSIKTTIVSKKLKVQ